MGLQALEQVREKLCSNLDNDIEVQDKVRKGEMKKVSFVYRLVFLYLPTYTSFNVFSMHQVFPDTPTLLLAQIHRVNRTLRNLLCDSRNPAVPATEGYSFNITVHQVPVETFRSLFIVTFKWQKYWILCLFVRYWRTPALSWLFRRKCLFLISWCFDVLFCTTFPCILCLQNVFCTEWI